MAMKQTKRTPPPGCFGRPLTVEILGPYSRFRLEQWHVAGSAPRTEWFVFDAEDCRDDGAPIMSVRGSERFCRSFIREYENRFIEA